MVGTANVAEGKSPAVTPVAMAAERALQRHSAMVVGSAGDQSHLQQAGWKIRTKDRYFFVFLFPLHIVILFFFLSFPDIHCRAVPAHIVIRFCEGYLAIHTDEAGACLCPSFANGGATDTAKFTVLQLYLNAAHGGPFSFSFSDWQAKSLETKDCGPKGTSAWTSRHDNEGHQCTRSVLAARAFLFDMVIICGIQQTIRPCAEVSLLFWCSLELGQASLESASRWRHHPNHWKPFCLSCAPVRPPHDNHGRSFLSDNCSAA